MLSLTSGEKSKSVLLRNKKKRDQRKIIKIMGGERKPILVGLALVMLLGIAVYLRLWTIDYSVSSDDTEFLRRQFDLANREAMDESAEWRLKYDAEVQKAAKCARELTEHIRGSAVEKDQRSIHMGLAPHVKIKESFEKVEDGGGVNQKLAMLQKENMALLKQVETLRQQLKAEKLKCHSQ